MFGKTPGGGRAGAYEAIRYHFLTVFPVLYARLDRRKAVIKFIIAGGLAAATDLLLLYFFHGPLGMGVVSAASLAFVIAFGVSFGLQKFWTFRDYRSGKLPGQLSLYFLNALLGLLANAGAMHVLVNRWSVWYLLSQVLVSAALAVWNYLLYRFVIFKLGGYEDKRQ